MKTINKPADNLGGLIKIWAVPNGDFSLSGTTLTFSDTDNIYEIYCTPDTKQFTEPMVRTTAGIHYNTAIKGFIPKDSVEVQDALEYIEPRKWAIVFIDGNGKYRFAGAAGALRLTSVIDTGKQVADRAGCQIEFAGKTTSRSVFIDNPF